MSFEIGEWIEIDEGIGQLLYVRDNVVEKYSTEFNEGKRVGENIGEILICKILCDYEGFCKKRNRIAAVKSEYASPVTKESKVIVDEIKKNKPNEYRDYILYDDKSDIGGSLHLSIKVEESVIDVLHNDIMSINNALPPSFTLNEFLKAFRDGVSSIDLDVELKKCPVFDPNFSIYLFCRLYKTINKKRIYSKVWSSS